jgi:hypothetical protein
LVSRLKPGGCHHGEEEEEDEDPEVICHIAAPFNTRGEFRYGCRRSFGSSFAKKGPASCRPFCFETCWRVDLAVERALMSKEPWRAHPYRFTDPGANS